MNRWSLKFVVLGVLIVVLMVFASPTLNLEPTAMRASCRIDVSVLPFAYFPNHDRPNIASVRAVIKREQSIDASPHSSVSRFVLPSALLG